MFWRVLNEWGVMPQRYYFWATCLSGGLLYCLVFIFAQDFCALDKHALHSQPALLLFLLPGGLMAFMQHSAPLKSTLLMASVGTLLAALLLHGIFAVPARWDYIMVWSLSGMFWAGCGALIVRLMKLIVAIRQ